ncbi:hypothetical protein SAMN04488564_103845 [Lentzea waywayandensis]|uniref:Uncharacterized protein n=2 Tax=Lentzea waywayandensis TaxID=84724 RepID=A0A1I6E4C3_9PSEU|nr:hypothetical protein SAMN04488564_103845 [Lentzea waywayandensis]
MSGQHEGLFTNIVDKFKDMLDGDDRKDKTPEPEDPPLTPQCCGVTPPGHPVVAMPVEHELDCPNHPGNVAKEEVAS